jgi:hypothetical protein
MKKTKCLLFRTIVSCLVFHSVLLAGEFEEEVRLTQPDPVNNDRFGTVVSVSGDTAVIAAPEHRSDGHYGAAYVYVHSGGSWSLQAKLVSPNPRPFARSVAIDGDRIVVGALEDRAIFGGIDAGLAYVFVRNGTAWEIEGELITADTPSPNRYGAAVDIKGDTVVIGAPEDPWAGFQSGSAYIFRRTDAGWVEEARLIGMETDVNDRFGDSVSLSGSRVAISAPLAEANGMEAAGEVNIFEEIPGVGWIQRTRLVPPTSDLIWGRSLSLDGSHLVVGHPNDGERGSSAGAAFYYTIENGMWTLKQKFFGGDTDAFDGFGMAVSIQNGTIVVGAPHISLPELPTVGTAYVFELAGGIVTETQQLFSSDQATFTGFGFATDLDGDTLAVGAMFHEQGNGAAYIFSRALDNVPPTIESIQASPDTLFPPNGKMVPVTLTVNAHDDSGEVTCRIIGVASDAPADGTTLSEITGDLTLNLRAERNPRGTTRTYSVVVECVDAAGNRATGHVPVTVPGNPGGKP